MLVEQQHTITEFDPAGVSFGPAPESNPQLLSPQELDMVIGSLSQPGGKGFADKLDYADVSQEGFANSVAARGAMNDKSAGRA